MYPELAVLVVVGLLVLKFILKPILKVLALLALVALAWWVLHGF